MITENLTAPLSYSRAAPFYAQLKRRYSLTSSESTKTIYHIELDLSGSGIEYRCGDSIAVLPSNAQTMVEEVITLLKTDGEHPVTDRNGNVLSLREFLSTQANLSTVQKKMLQTIHEGLSEKNLEKKAQIATLLNDRTLCKEYLDSRDLIDILREFPDTDIDPITLCSQLRSLMPRFYSIASSQKVVGDEVHLTVAPVSYTNKGRTYHGTATQWLCEQLEPEQSSVPLYLQSAHDFSLPRDSNTPIIMIGPGTGIAPFRAFMQERIASAAQGKHWLFFGERTENEFLYGDYWKQLEQEGVLRLSCAFSRTQPQKVYVQHRMLEEGKTLFSWIEKGAHLYVCGDANHMAKDVENALCKIISSHGGYTEADAKEYLKARRKEGRYQRDVY